MTFLAFLAFVGCTPQVDLDTWQIVTPPRMWTTSRPMPCAFREVGQVGVEGWTRESAEAGLSNWLDGGNADAIIDLVVGVRIARMSERQCKEVPTCNVEDSQPHAVPVWSAEGLAVNWVPGCVLKPTDALNDEVLYQPDEG